MYITYVLEFATTYLHNIINSIVVYFVSVYTHVVSLHPTSLRVNASSHIHCPDSQPI